MVKMPPRKEPKAAIVYPSSKTKVPAYKPLRPSGIPQVQVLEAGSSSKAASAAVKQNATRPAKRKSTDHDDRSAGPSRTGSRVFATNDSEDELDKMGAFRPASNHPAHMAAPQRRKSPTCEASPMSIASDPGGGGEPAIPMPSQSDDTPSIPQPLLIRLLHESFIDKNTRIDTEAIQVLQKYVEIFVREAIARAQAEKAEKAERGDCTEQDASWLELEDLEAVAPGLVLDF